MQLLHLLSLPPMFSRTKPSSTPSFREQTFMVRVRLTLLSPRSKWPQCARTRPRNDFYAHRDQGRLNLSMVYS